MANDLRLEVRGDGPLAASTKRHLHKGGRATSPRTTTFHEEGLHVGTIVEYVDDTGKGNDFCNWYTASAADVATTYEEAEKRMREAIAR